MRTGFEMPPARCHDRGVTRSLRISARGLLILAVITCALLPGCTKRGESEAGNHLQPLAELPPLDVKPVKWPTSNRARLLMTDAGKALKDRDCSKAATLAVEAVTLDPSLTSARLELARIYAACGVPTTAIALLQQLAKASSTCGGCREAIASSQQDKTLAALWKTATGAKIAKHAPDLALPTQKWATDVAADLAAGKADALATLIHPNEPWELIRACPACLDEARKKPEKKRFFGYAVARKVAMRFAPDSRELGAIPLKVDGAPTCSGRCCQWAVKRPLPLDSAALSMLCFRPITPKQGALTRLELVYGQPRVDAEAQAEAIDKARAGQRKATDERAGRHKVVHLAAPATGS